MPNPYELPRQHHAQRNSWLDFRDALVAAITDTENYIRVLRTRIVEAPPLLAQYNTSGNSAAAAQLTADVQRDLAELKVQEVRISRNVTGGFTAS